MAANLWLSYAFLTASVYATLSLLNKVVLDQDVSTPFLAASLSNVPKFAIFMVVALATGSVAFAPAALSLDYLVPISLASFVGIINVISGIVMYRGMDVTDVSRFIPLINTDIVFVVVLGAVFLSESFAPPVYLGVFAIFAGTLLISIEDIMGGMKIMSREALVFGLSTAFVIALVSLLLKVLMPLLALYEILFWFGAGGIAASVVIGAWKWGRGTLGGAADTEVSLLSYGSLSLMISGIVTAMAYFTLVWALQSGPVSIVTAIANLEVLLVFFGVIVLTKYTPEVLQEPMDRVTLIQKFTASILMLAGVVVIQLFQ